MERIAFILLIVLTLMMIDIAVRVIKLRRELMNNYPELKAETEPTDKKLDTSELVAVFGDLGLDYLPVILCSTFVWESWN